MCSKLSIFRSMSLSNQLKALNAQYYPKHLFYGPSWIVLGVNNICNLHCKMCDVGVDFNKSNFFQNLMGSRPVNMPLELITDILEQTARYFPKANVGYAFTEPLIYPHLETSLHTAQQLGLFTSLTTNALNLKRFADRLVDGGLDEINISLDGPPDIHNFIRGHKRSFERAIAGIEYLLEQKKAPRIAVYCVITEWNIGHLSTFLEFFKPYPLHKIGFMHTNFTPTSVADLHNSQFGDQYPATASNMTEIKIENMNLRELWDDIQTIRSRTYPFPIVFSPQIDNFEQLDIFYNQPKIKLGSRCHDIFHNIMIKSDGTVIPAHGRCYNLTIGNVYENNLKEIWNAEKIRQFRQTVNQAGGLLPACSRCCSGFGN